MLLVTQCIYVYITLLTIDQHVILSLKIHKFHKAKNTADHTKYNLAISCCSCHNYYWTSIIIIIIIIILFV